MAASKNQNKTVETADSVGAFLATVENTTRRQDAHKVIEMMQRVTGQEPRMWGSAIIGFGTYHYKYDSGREGDSMVVGFSPRKTSLVLYIMAGFREYDDLMARLGKHSTGKSCLYVKKLADVDMAVLEEIVARSVEWMRTRYPASRPATA